jgi:hypothetical protein
LNTFASILRIEDGIVRLVNFWIEEQEYGSNVVTEVGMTYVVFVDARGYKINLVLFLS